MSYKGDWNRVKDHKAYAECPIWNKTKTRLIDFISEYPDEMLTYECEFDLEQFDLPLETHFKSITELPLDLTKTAKLGLLHAHLNHDESEEAPRVFLVTNHNGQTCKVAVWMGNE